MSQKTPQPCRDRLVDSVAVKAMEQLAAVAISIEKRTNLVINQSAQVVQVTRKLGRVERDVVHGNGTPSGRRPPRLLRAFLCKQGVTKTYPDRCKNSFARARRPDDGLNYVLGSLAEDDPELVRRLTAVGRMSSRLEVRKSRSVYAACENAAKYSS